MNVMLALVVVLVLLLVAYYVMQQKKQPAAKQPVVQQSAVQQSSCDINAYNNFLKVYILDNDWGFEPQVVAGCGGKIGYRWTPAGYEVYINDAWKLVSGRNEAYGLLKR